MLVENYICSYIVPVKASKDSESRMFAPVPMLPPTKIVSEFKSYLIQFGEPMPEVLIQIVDVSNAPFPPVMYGVYAITHKN